MATTRGRHNLADFLDPSENSLRSEWRSVAARLWPQEGKRQVDFVPGEVVLSLCASLLVDHRPFGSSSADRAGFPVQHLAKLYKRKPTSILAKMANLDGTRSNGGKHELEVSARMSADPDLLADVYLRIIRAARLEGFDPESLPDFLELEDGGHLLFAGQDELVASEVERSLEQLLEKWAQDRRDVPVEVTQKLLMSTARIGQHRFATQVLTNHGHRCVFCGMSAVIAGTKWPRLLNASHIKPWRDCSNSERLDFRNGLTACPTHDVAFDTGLITVDAGMTIRRARDLEVEIMRGGAIGQALGSPPLFSRLLLPETAVRPDVSYLGWHKVEIFVGT